MHLAAVAAGGRRSSWAGKIKMVYYYVGIWKWKN
jgi:hypothetical protein